MSPSRGRGGKFFLFYPEEKKRKEKDDASYFAHDYVGDAFGPDGVAAVAATFTGTDGPNSITGTANADIIKGLGGGDVDIFAWRRSILAMMLCASFWMASRWDEFFTLVVRVWLSGNGTEESVLRCASSCRSLAAFS